MYLKLNEISEKAVEFARAQYLENEGILSLQVGWWLAKMRSKRNRAGENQARVWKVLLKNLEILARAKRLDENGGISLQGNGLNGLNGLLDHHV